jgi:hypothetical protein
MEPNSIATSLFNQAARHTLEWKIHWLLRLAVCCEFVGHGAFGMLTKQGWVPYFALYGIPEPWAWQLMPLVGSVDIALGLLALVTPFRAALLYMACWGCFTATLRPSAGEGWWEFFERSYNFGIPFLLLWMHGFGVTKRSWFAVLTQIPRFTVVRAQGYQLALRGIMASRLIGHSGLGLVMGKAQLLRFYEMAGFGVFGVPFPALSAVLGGCEMLLGALCVAVTSTAFFLLVFLWKLGSEFL